MSARRHSARPKTAARRKPTAAGRPTRGLAERDEALRFQAAAADILASLRGSGAKALPVFDAIVDKVRRLFNSRYAAIFLVKGDQLELAAMSSDALYGRSNGEALERFREGFPQPIDSDGMTGRALRSARAMQLTPIIGNPRASRRAVALAKTLGYDSMVVTPLVLQGRAIGGISTTQPKARRYRGKELALFRAFADLAVIAIEYERLFKDTKEALERQVATGEVLSSINGSVSDAQPVFDAIVNNVNRLFRTEFTGLELLRDGQIHLVAAGAAAGKLFEYIFDAYPQPLDEDSTTGRAMLRRRVVAVCPVDDPAAPPITRRMAAKYGNYNSIVGVPMIRGGRVIGAIGTARTHALPFSEAEVALLRSFADQAVIAIENVRLFNEIQEKSAQLEIANKHKSEFLANMSHELRTPLNAIIGFSEVLMERMFGELNVKQADYLKDIHESGKHLLSLINDILDLSKIEAGRMELELSSFHLPNAIENAMMLVRERAQRHGIQLGQEIDRGLGEFQGDERKVKQILLNLLSNAVKFTPDGGRVNVTVKLDTGKVAIAVRDTGVGIAPEDQAALFEEFKQVGRDSTRKSEGTGLGLALTRKFVELHGGTIEVQSAPGSGSTFSVWLPLR